MTYRRTDFVPFSVDAGRVVANLEAAYEQWLDARQQLAAMPVSMYWQAKQNGDYLAVKQRSSGPGTTDGPRSSATEDRLAEYTQRKAELKARAAQADTTIAERAAQYRALRLPPLADRQGEILRALDTAQLLRHDVMVVGTNAFVAYSLLCNARFPTGVEETEDFDLAWCRGSGVSLTRVAPAASDAMPRASLMSVLQGMDASFRLVSLREQAWLLKGRPVAVVVATIRQRACPLYVPDPRWMALHKLWLARKPERNAIKKPKDRRQGEVLLSACRYFLADSYPIDIDFVLELPTELRDLFTQWAEASGFDPMKPDA